MLWWGFSPAGARAAFVYAGLSAGAYLVAATELLSIVGWLTPTAFGLTWMALVLLTVIPRLNADAPRLYLATQAMTLIENTRRDTLLAVYVGGMAVVLLITGMIGMLAPINNWDSMTYHLPRIMHWLQNESLYHYPTGMPRQLFQSPYSEYVILHTIGLSGGDGFANGVQWFALIASAIGASLIVRELGGGMREGVLAAAFTMTDRKSVV